MSAFMVCLLVCTVTHAQAFSALPAVWRVPSAEDTSTALRLSPSVGYGYTEPVLNESDQHHRVLGALGLGLTSTRGIGFEARAQGRHDTHESQGKRDSGTVIDPRFALRYSHALGARFSGLAQLGAWIPGGKAPLPSFPATTLDALLALSFLASARSLVSGLAGYRFDRSSRSIKSPTRLSGSDWVALGVSQFDAALFGLGAKHALGKATLFGELTYDVLVGSGAPRLAAAPLRAGLGVSAALNDATTGSLGVEALLGARAKADPSASLVPFEPRVTVMLGITHTFDFRKRHPAPAPRIVHSTVQPSAANIAPAHRVGVLRVMVRDAEHGEPLEATVRVVVRGESAAMLEATTQQGKFETELAPGPVEVLIAADGFSSQQRRVVLDEQGVTVVNIDLRPQPKPAKKKPGKGRRR